MSGRSKHNKPTDKNQPNRFPNGARENVNSPNPEEGRKPHECGSSFGEGNGTGLGLKHAPGFGEGKQVEAGYGGPQYAGGSNYPAGNNPYGRPQQTGFNASPGSGSQYSAADSQGPSPAGNIPKGKTKKWKKRK